MNTKKIDKDREYESEKADKKNPEYSDFSV